MIIAVIGGSGKLGNALARRFARCGHEVIIGTRDVRRARDTREESDHSLDNATNVDAASVAQIIVVAVPFAVQEETLQAIAPVVQGKLVIDTTVPLSPPAVTKVRLPPEGSAAVRAQQILGSGVKVVSAFHNVAANKLADAHTSCDVLIFGDDDDARMQTLHLVREIGLRGIHGGRLSNSAAAEAMTSVLIYINRTYKVDGAGFQITNL
jgi:8-hydroxy-5-deazaflavin:NADPH oxidoreductase